MASLAMQAELSVQLLLLTEPVPQRMSGFSNQKHTHVALLPSGGMGHLTPFLRLAAALTVHNVEVTIITPYPTVSVAESQALSRFFASFPHITQKQLHLLALDKQPNDSDDPFYYHFEVIRRSSHLLSPLLSSLSPPLSALLTDMSLASTVIPITQPLNLPNYVFFTSSARMLTLFISFPTLAGSRATGEADDKDFLGHPGLEPIPTSSIPPPLLQNTNNLLKTYFVENGKKMMEANGIIVNTFESLEQDSLRKLNHGKVLERLPPVTAIGPLQPCSSGESQPLAWLDGQPAGSVVYVSFGSRTAMSREQIRELGKGLVRSSRKFVWVVKDKKVDQEDDEELIQVIGQGLMDCLKDKGLVVKHWLSQEDILGHPAVGGFLSHCGWNSVTEALWHGVPILAWPQHGDQKINADIVQRAGVGMWVENWGWGGETVVSGVDIAEKINEMMDNDSFRNQAMHIKEEARKAAEVGGDSWKGLTALIEKWKFGGYLTISK